MSSIGTFGSFTAARLGIYTSQQGLSITGNNISNINTKGYTRQVLDQVSLSGTGPDRYASRNKITPGVGAMGVGISQLRDPYLDIRYRTQTANVGAMSELMDGYNNIAAVLDEVGAGDEENGILGAYFSDLLTSMQNLNEYTNEEEFDAQVRSSAQALLTQFNSFAKQLEEVRTNAVSHLEEDVRTVNKILYSIRDLNSAIRKSEIHGDNALEMRDERNRLIDELSSYMKIDVTYSEEDIGAGMKVEKLSIKLANANPDTKVTTDSSTLIDGIYATQLSIIKEPVKNEKGEYLTPEGEVTTDEKEAATKYNDNFLMRLSTLRDINNQPWEEVSKPYTQNFADEAASEAKKAELLALDGKDVEGAPKDTTYSVEVSPDGKTITVFDNNGTTTRYSFDTKMTGPADAQTPVYTYTTTTTRYTVKVDLDDNDLYGSLQSARELLTEAGEFSTPETINGIDEKAASKRGIPYYQHTLDLLANKFASAMNEANTGYMYTKIKDETTGEFNSFFIDDGGKPLEVAGEMLSTDVEKLTDDQKTAIGAKADPAITADDFDKLSVYDRQLLVKNFIGTLTKTDENGDPVKDDDNNEIPLCTLRGGPLFSNLNSGDDTTGITASNISISHSWSTGDQKVVSTFFKADGFEQEASTDNENVLHMRALLEADFNFIPSTIVEGSSDIPMFKGSFTDMLNNMQSVLGNDMRSTAVSLNTYSAYQLDLDTSRDSVSSVDLNDEAMNMMQYQKSYSAACRMMTVLDEVLDRLVNNTGIVGR